MCKKFFADKRASEFFLFALYLRISVTGHLNNELGHNERIQVIVDIFPWFTNISPVCFVEVFDN